MDKPRPADAFLTPKQLPLFRTPKTKHSSPSLIFKSSRSRTSIKSPFGDRFIPNRTRNDMETSHHILTSSSSKNLNDGEKTTAENNVLASRRRLFLEVWSGGNQAHMQNKVLSLSCKMVSKIEKNDTYERDLSLKYRTTYNIPSSTKAKRTLPDSSDLILDVPALRDDFYLNLIDWSKKSNKIAIGIDDQVYLWNSGTKTSIAIPEMTQTRTREEIFVTSVKWMPNKSEVLAVAMSDCTIYLCNIETGQCVGKILDHEYRVASLSWLNESVLSSGSFAGLVLNHDVRCCTKQEKKLSEWTFHQADICGLSWSTNERLLAVGSDDKMVSLWEKSRISSNCREPMIKMNEHKAAVKALSWCPWNTGVLATGGGKQDGTIKLWNVFSGVLKNSIETNSQVSGLIWSKFNRELLSSHGEPDHQLSVWKFPSLNKIGDIHGHAERVLSIALSPNGEQVVSLGADETLRFWKCFNDPLFNKKINSTPIASCLNLQGIR